jgi:hypothetical protein
VRLSARGFTYEQSTPDATLDYVARARRPFDELRDLVCQLAGLAVLINTGTRFASVVEYPTDAVMRDRFQRLRDEILALSSTGAGLHHRQHLLCAAEQMGNFLEAFSERDVAKGGRQVPLATLKRAWIELLAASSVLPGFTVVDLRQSCGCTAGLTIASRA